MSIFRIPKSVGASLAATAKVAKTLTTQSPQVTPLQAKTAPFQPIRLALTILFALILIGCSPKQDSNTLVVGMELAYPPFEMTDEQNRPAGISVEIARALAADLGKELRIENIPFAGLIPALKTSKIDVIISSMTRTEERAQSIAFSDPYLTTGLCVLVSKDTDAASITDLDRKGRRIAVKQGTTGHIYANENINNAEVLLFEKEAAAVIEVTQKKADAFIYDQMSTYMNWKKHPETTRPLLSPFTEEAWAIGLRLGDDELRSNVNRFLARFKTEGGFDRLGDQFLSEQKQAFEKLGFPFFF